MHDMRRRFGMAAVVLFAFALAFGTSGLAAGQQGKPAGATAQQCLASDPRGAVAKALDKTPADRFAVDGNGGVGVGGLDAQAGWTLTQQATGTAYRAFRPNLAGQALVNLCSNDYLGLTHHPRLKAAAIEAVRYLEEQGS